MKTNKLLIGLAVSAALLNSAAMIAYADNSIIPFGNGAWVYDTTYDNSGNKLTQQAGLFVKALSDYNNAAESGHEIDQVFAYGGDLEMYCAGSGGSDISTPCTPNSMLITFYPPSSITASKNNWPTYFKNIGDSGFASFEQYKQVPKIKNYVIVLDGRVDNNAENDYLNHLNTLTPTQAAHFAAKVAKTICASDDVDGVQFDIEPFAFAGTANGSGILSHGQQYFYTEIAKDFAGYYDHLDNPEGTNPKIGTDLLNCVDTKHPNGRFFSVFTFSSRVTPKVAEVFTRHGNGMIVDSLYDLASEQNVPAGHLTTLQLYKALIKPEIQNMENIADQYGLAFQFAIPAAASAHEFEKLNGVPSGQSQYKYVTNTFDALNLNILKNDPNFKGIDVWAWTQQMSNSGYTFSPAAPKADVLGYLQKNL